MTEKRPLIPRSRMDGGLATEPHPATLESSETPDAVNMLALHGAINSRPGLRPLNAFAARGSGIRSTARTWDGEDTDYSPGSPTYPYPRRTWLGSGIIPYIHPYNWANGIQLFFRLKVGHQAVMGFNDHETYDPEAYYRRFIIGSGAETPTHAEGSMEKMFTPDWVIYLADGADNEATDDGAAATGTAGYRYLCAALTERNLGAIYSFGVTISGARDCPLFEGDEIDVHLFVSDDGVDGLNFLLEWRYAGTTTWYQRVENLPAGVEPTQMMCREKTIQVWGWYAPDIHWCFSRWSKTDIQGDSWLYNRMIPGEGVIESILLVTPVEKPAAWHWPSHVKLTAKDLEHLPWRCLGYWPGYGDSDGQFLDTSTQRNHGFFAPSMARIFQEEDRLPGLLLDSISGHTVHAIAHDTGAQHDQIYTGDMVDQFVASRTISTAENEVFDEEVQGSPYPVILSLTLGTTATLFENRQVYLVRALRNWFDAADSSLTPSAEKVLLEIEAFVPSGGGTAIKATIYPPVGCTFVGNSVSIEGPEAPLGRPFTVTVTAYLYKALDGDKQTKHFSSGSMSMWVNDDLVGTEVLNFESTNVGESEDHIPGPLREILAGPYNGLIHDVRLGTHDYDGDNETRTMIALPNTPHVLSHYSAERNPAGQQICRRLKYLSRTATTNPCPYDTGGGYRAMAVQIRHARHETIRRPWVTGISNHNYTVAIGYRMCDYAKAPSPNAAGDTLHSTLIGDTVAIPATDLDNMAGVGECWFSWIYAWWRVWPNRAGDGRSRVPQVPGRCWRRYFHFPGAGPILDSNPTCSCMADDVMPEVLENLGDMAWIGAYVESDAGVNSSAHVSPVFYRGLAGNTMSPIDLGPRWGESSLLPADAEGEVAFTHHWLDGEGTELFLGSSRNLYLFAPPWGTEGTRLRHDGYSYWEHEDVVSSHLLAPVYVGDPRTVWVGFWYRRRSSASGDRVIACAWAENGTHPWVIFDRNGKLYVGIGEWTCRFKLVNYTASDDAYEDLFSDRQKHWVVVKMEGAWPGATVISAWWDGDELVPEFAGGLASVNSIGNLKLRIGGGCDQQGSAPPWPYTPMIPKPGANVDCEIWGVRVGNGAAAPFPLIPFETYPYYTNHVYAIPFTEGSGLAADDAMVSSSVYYHGRDLLLLDDNLPYMGGKKPTVVQAGLDAALICPTGRPRRWRRDRDGFGSDTWIVDHLGLPDPWEEGGVRAQTALDAVPPGPGLVVGELAGETLYYVGVRFYDAARDLYTQPLIFATGATTDATCKALYVFNIPRCPYGRATHTEILISTSADGQWVVARKLVGTAHLEVEILLIEYPNELVTFEWGEPPVANVATVINEVLVLGNLPHVSDQAIHASGGGYYWTFPPTQVKRIGNAQSGSVQALATLQGRVFIAQRNSCTWASPGATFAESTFDEIVNGVGFVCRWGRMSWAGLLIGMSSRGPVVAESAQIQFLGEKIRSAIPSGREWIVTYDNVRQAWWFLVAGEEDFNDGFVLTKSQDKETWSKVRMPQVSSVGEALVENDMKLVFGTFHGRVCVMDGAVEMQIPTAGDTDVFTMTLAQYGYLYLFAAGVSRRYYETLRGMPILTEDELEGVIYGPEVNDDGLIGLRVRSTGTLPLILAPSLPGGQILYRWSSPWMNFGAPSRRKEIFQFWLCFSATANTLILDFATALSTTAVTRPMTRDFPTPAWTKTIDMTNGFMTSPVQLGQHPGSTGSYWRFRIRGRSTATPWNLWNYLVEGEYAGGRAE